MPSVTVSAHVVGSVAAAGHALTLIVVGLAPLTCARNRMGLPSLVRPRSCSPSNVAPDLHPHEHRAVGIDPQTYLVR